MRASTNDAHIALSLVAAQQRLSLPVPATPEAIRPTVGVSGGWAGADSAWEQDSFEAWKMLVNRADS